MLPGMMIPLGAAEQGGGATISYLQQSTDAANRSTYTFASQNLGAADATRRIVVAVGGYEFAGTPQRPAVTVAGVTATVVVDTSVYSSFYGYRCGIYIASVPTGTTGTITATYPRTESACGYAAWRVTDLISSTAYDTASTNGTGGSVNVNVANGGFIVAAGFVYPDTTNSWTGVTERFDVAIESGRTFTGGDHTATATEAPRTVTLISASSAETTVAASWV